VAQRPRTGPLPLLETDTRLKTSVLFLLTVLAVGWSAWFTFSGEDDQRWPQAPIEASGPGEERPPQQARVVPDVVGVRTSVARDRLLLADLTLGRVIPTPGPPGVVVRADPATGQAHTAGTPVTLYVGVEPDRLEQEVEVP
jgi:beta-lactam-binding protein with PASTA domain